MKICFHYNLIMILRKVFTVWPKTVSIWKKCIYFRGSHKKQREEAEIASSIFEKLLEDPMKNHFSINKQLSQLMKQSLRQQIFLLVQNYSFEDINVTSNRTNQVQNNNRISQNNQKQKNQKEQSSKIRIKSKINRKNCQNSSIRDYLTHGGLVDNKIFHKNQAQNRCDPTSQKENSQKISFIPSYLTTHQLWKLIYRSQTKLLIGQKGIGKSYSALLFKIMSDIIHKYRKIQYLQQFPHYQNSKRKQYILNPKIDYRIPKIIYLCLDQEDTKQSIEQKILSQCFQLSAQQINSIKDQTYSKSGILQGVSLKRIYEQKFKYGPSLGFYLIFDNIDLLTSRIRTRDQFYKMTDTKQYQNKGEQQRNIMIKQKFNMDQNKLFKKLKLISINTYKMDLYQSFNRIYFLGSQYIQEKILSRMDLNLQHKHMAVEVQKIDYFNKIKTKAAVLDFVEMIVTNLEAHKHFVQYFDKIDKKEKKISDQKLQKSKLKQDKQVSCQQFIERLRVQLYGILKEKYCFMTPYYIHQTISALPETTFNKDFYQKKEYRIQVIKVIVDQVIKKSINDYEQDFKKFLQACSLNAAILYKFQIQVSKRLAKIQKIYKQLKQIYENELKNQNQLSDQKKYQIQKLKDEIKYQQNVYIKILGFECQKNELETFLPKKIVKLIHCYRSSRQIEVKLLLPVEVMSYLIQKYKKKITQIQIKVGMNFKRFDDKKYPFKTMVEKKFRNLIESGQAQISWNLQNQELVNNQKGQIKKYAKLYKSFIYCKNNQEKQNQQYVPIYGFIPIPLEKPLVLSSSSQYVQSQNSKQNMKFNQNNQVKFLYSFKEFFSKRQIKMENKPQTFIFYPLKPQFQDKITQISQKGLKSMSNNIILPFKTNKFVIAQAFSGKIHLNYYDIAENESQLADKIVKFLTSYVTFGDKYETQLTDEHGQIHKTELNYIVLTPKKYPKNSWSQEVKQFFETYNKQHPDSTINVNQFIRSLMITRSNNTKSSPQPLLLKKLINITFDDLIIHKIHNINYQTNSSLKKQGPTIRQQQQTKPNSVKVFQKILKLFKSMDQKVEE